MHICYNWDIFIQVPSSQPSELPVANQVGYWPHLLATGGVFPGRRPDAHVPGEWKDAVLSSAATASTTNIVYINIR